jgi:putative transposase
LLTLANSCEDFVVRAHEQECLTSLVERSVTADALIDELDRLALTRGYPAVLRCDNAPSWPARRWPTGPARMVITDWKDDYNHRRRHSSLGYQTPAVYAAACTHR